MIKWWWYTATPDKQKENPPRQAFFSSYFLTLIKAMERFDGHSLPPLQ